MRTLVAPGMPNPVTGKLSPGRGYAAATVVHCESVLRGFYGFYPVKKAKELLKKKGINIKVVDLEIKFGGGRIRKRNSRKAREDARTQSELRRVTYATVGSWGVEDAPRKRQQNTV